MDLSGTRYFPGLVLIETAHNVDYIIVERDSICEERGNLFLVLETIEKEKKVKKGVDRKKRW